MNSGPEHTPNLTRRIVEDLGLAIVTGRYSAAGGFPVESELCDQYNASRSVLREAVKMLTAKGLLRARQRAGTTVEPEEHWRLLDPDILRWLLERDYSADILVELTDMRLAIEPRAAELAADGASGRERAAIVAALGYISAATSDDDDRLEAEIDFHRAVLQASNNRFMRQAADLSEAALRLGSRRPDGVAMRASASAYRRIADAIVTGDPQTAAASMRALLSAMREEVVRADRSAFLLRQGQSV